MLGFFSPVNRNLCVPPVGGGRRGQWQSLMSWFSYWSVTEGVWQAGGIRLYTTCQTGMRELSGMLVPSPLSPHTHTHTPLFSFLFGLSAPLSTICSMMFPYSSQTYEWLSSSSSNGCLFGAERGYHIVTHCYNHWGGHLTRQEQRETAAELGAFCMLGPSVCACVCVCEWG